MGFIEAHSETLWELIDEHAELERVATGFQFTEGPVWHPRDHYLRFSEIPGNARLKYTLDGKVVDDRRPSNKGNGLTYDVDLNLIICEHLSSSLVREHPDGTRETLASHFEGRELNSPNDVCVGKGGSIYFSDPTYGRLPGFGSERDQDLDFQGVFRIPPGGDLELVVERDRYAQPNGLCFSPDESLLYINDSPNALIDVYDVARDGSLGKRRRFAENIGRGILEEGIPDGMKCDAQGNIWVTGPRGLWIFNSSGQHIGTLLIPEQVGNLAWGGRDWHTLYVPSSTSLYAIRTKAGPHHEPYMGHSNHS